ncbi:hypothetical protein [Streptomyces lunalinharesii]|uniref:Lipoprotein n=1 Tax=Streptomyces lunalinharesii TaxID=333384 RepID=A0ABN3RQ82_9ACTN
MTRHRIPRLLAAAAALLCAAGTLTSCATASPADAAPAADTPACKLFRPISHAVGLGEPSVSTVSADGCTAYGAEYGTLTLSLDDRPLAAASRGDGKRTEMEVGGRHAVMLMGAINGVCKIFLESDDRSSVELRLGRTTAMTPQVCAALKPVADKVAGRLPAAG